MEAVHQQLLEKAVKAPSGHNTQPWLFKMAWEHELRVHPDFRRALPVVDPDNHALYISLGCAVENIAVTARQNGYRPEVNLDTDEAGTTFIRITLKADETVEGDPLYGYIDQRQSTRNAYRPDAVPAESLDALTRTADFPGIQLMGFHGPNAIADLMPFIIEGSNRQFNNPAFVRELVQWIRFSKKEAERRQDGIRGASMGFPAIPRWMGKAIMKYIVNAKSEAKRWRKLLDATSGLFLFLAEAHDEQHWVTLGRAFQRFGLKATELGISHAHVNMPCEEATVRQQLAEDLGLHQTHPLLLIRYGYSANMPFSYRRPLADVVAEDR